MKILPEIRAGRQNEELLLGNVCGSRLYQWVATVYDVYMKLSSLNLCKHKQDDDADSDTYKPLNDTLEANLRPDIPWGLQGHVRFVRYWRLAHSKLGLSLRLAFVCAILFNLHFRAVLLYVHDTLMAGSHQQTKSGSNHTDECALEQDLYHSEPDKVERALAIYRYLQSLGQILMDMPGIGVTTVCIVGLLPYVFHHFSHLLLRLQPVRVDFLAFLYQPQAYRRQMLQEARRVVIELIESLQNRHRQRIKRGVNHEDEWRTTTMINHEDEEEEDDELELSQKAVDDLKFLQLLLEVNRQHLVQPICVSAQWLELLAKFLGFMLIFSFVAAFLFPFGCFIFTIISELFLRSLKRLKRIRCQRWHSDAVPLGDILLTLDPLKSDLDKSLYLEHDGSLSSLIGLAFKVEGPNFFTPASSLFVLSYMIVLGYLTLLSTTLVNMFIFATLDKLAWMKQLEAQINEAQELLELRGGSGDDEHHLTSQLIVTYINFELFRRRHQFFKPVAHFFMLQALAMATIGFIVFYLIGTSVRTTMVILILVSIGAVAAVINIYLAGSSLVSKRMERIMRDVVRLLALLTKTQTRRVRHLYAVELWRRQCLAYLEEPRSYDTHLLGFYISYKKLVSFNVYAIGLFLFLMKINT